MDFDQDNEDIVKGYDPLIMRRLVGFLKPYIVPVVFAVIALLVATAGELFVPVLLQRSVDDYLVVSWFRVSEKDMAVPDLHVLSGKKKPVLAGGYRYFHEKELASLTRVQKDRLAASGTLTEERFYLAKVSPETMPVLSDLGDSVLIDVEAGGRGTAGGRDTAGGGLAAVPLEALKGLTKDQKRALRYDDFQGLTRMSILLLVILGSGFGFTFLQIYLMAYTGQGVMRAMRLKLFDHTLRQSLSFLNRNPLGKLVNRVTNDVETVNELFTSVLISLLKDVSIMAGVFVVLVILNRRLGIIALATLPPVAIITILFRSKARDAYRKVRVSVSRVTAYLSEHISGMAVVQMFVREKQTGKEFAERNRDLLHANLGEMRVMAVFRPLIDLLEAVSIAVIIYLGARFLLKEAVSLGTLIAFINLIRQFFHPVMDLSEKYTILQSAMAGSERVFALIDEEDRIPDEGRRELPVPLAGSVEFRNVSFSYKEGEPVIRNLSFTVNPGETVAIVGYTGAGKTTISSLLARMWDIQSGSIHLDGIDVRDLPLSVLREAVQPVPQDVFMFNDTVEENIRLGRDIPDNEVRRAAEHVQAVSFIDALPDKFGTQLRERGSNLSTGQRQLLSFARVLAHNPKIIILDEATSSIDTETERLIQTAIQELMRGRTSLVIAHRLSTIKHADRILVLHRGKLAEEGRHEELLAKDGMYAKLYKLQFG